MNDQDMQEQLRQEQVAAERNEMPGSPKVEENADAANELQADTVMVLFVQDGEAFGVGSVESATVKINGEATTITSFRDANPSDLYRACTEVAKDVQVSETAARTVQQMAMFTQQMQKQMEAQNIAKKAGVGGSGLHVPGR